MSPVYKVLLEINKKSGQTAWGLEESPFRNTHPFPHQTELFSRTCRTREEGQRWGRRHNSTRAPHLPSWFWWGQPGLRVVKHSRGADVIERMDFGVKKIWF